jgi:Sensors of blue-light using FAD
VSIDRFPPRTTETTRHVLYLSQAVAGLPPESFARICQRSRDHNAAAGIGGVLLYDGQRFAQWMYGPDAAVRSLMQRIAADPRHEAIAVLLDAVRPDGPDADLATEPLPGLWRVGYTDPDALPAYAAAVAFMAEPAAEALPAFLRLLPGADLWPPA